MGINYWIYRPSWTKNYLFISRQICTSSLKIPLHERREKYLWLLAHINVAVKFNWRNISQIYVFDSILFLIDLYVCNGIYKGFLIRKWLCSSPGITIKIKAPCTVFLISMFFLLWHIWELYKKLTEKKTFPTYLVDF